MMMEKITAADDSRFPCRELFCFLSVGYLSELLSGERDGGSLDSLHFQTRRYLKIRQRETVYLVRSLS